MCVQRSQPRTVIFGVGTRLISMFATELGTPDPSPSIEREVAPEPFYGTTTALSPYGIRTKERRLPLAHSKELSEGCSRSNNDAPGITKPQASGEDVPHRIRTEGRLDPFMVTEVGYEGKRSLLAQFQTLRSEGKLVCENHALHEEARKLGLRGKTREERGAFSQT